MNIARAGPHSDDLVSLTHKPRHLCAEAQLNALRRGLLGHQAQEARLIHNSRGGTGRVGEDGLVLQSDRTIAVLGAVMDGDNGLRDPQVDLGEEETAEHRPAGHKARGRNEHGAALMACYAWCSQPVYHQGTEPQAGSSASSAQSRGPRTDDQQVISLIVAHAFNSSRATIIRAKSPERNGRRMGF